MSACLWEVKEVNLQQLLKQCCDVAQGHDLREHMAVFWVAPLSGALLAGLFWNYITRTPAKKAPRGPKYTPKKNSAAGKQAKKDE